MIKEKHVLKNPYNHHALSRYIDVYEVSANRCHSVPESGYKGTEATLVDDPAWNEKFSSYSITGATLTGNNFILNNDVTAQANYETAKNLTTIRCNSTKNSGFIGDTASLSNTPAWNERFSSYSITGSTLTGSNFRFTGSDITAQANYETAKNLTLQTDGHGTIAANKNSGFIGDIGTVTATPNSGYSLGNYSTTGTTMTGNNYKFTGSNITIKANFLSSYELLYQLDSFITADGNHVYDIDISKYPFTIINLSIKNNDNDSLIGAADLNLIFNNSPWNNFTNTNNAWRLRSHWDYEPKYPTCRTINRTSPQATWTGVYPQIKSYSNDDVTTYFNTGNRYASIYLKYTFCIDRNRNVCEEFISTTKMGSGNLVAGNIFNGIKNISEAYWDYDYGYIKVYGCTAESQVSGVVTGGVPK